VAYGAIYLLIGLRFSWGIWLGLAHLLLYENILSRIGDGPARGSIRSYLATVVGWGSDFTVALADRNSVAAVLVPLAVAAVAVAFTAVVLAGKDVE